jgi:hypothetical protein
MGGAGEGLLILLLILLSPAYRRSGVGGEAGETAEEEVLLDEPAAPRELLLELLFARLATDDEPGWGRGFAVLGGGGGGTIAAAADDFGSLFFDELFLLSW